MTKLTTCKSCGKEVAKSAKNCPHCGAKLKMGLMLKMLIALVIIGGVINFVLPSTDKVKARADHLQTLQALAAQKPSDLSAYGELADMFNLGSDFTNLQRDAKEKELAGTIVEWKLPVYEVAIKDKEKKIYRVQTTGKGGLVSTFVNIHAMDDEDEHILSSMKTGNVIHFKGKFKDVSMRSVNIDPAILVRNRSSAESIQVPTNVQAENKRTPEKCYEQAYEENKKDRIQELKAAGQNGPYAEQDLVPMGVRRTLEESCGLNDDSKPNDEEKPVAAVKSADQGKQQPIIKPSFDCTKASSSAEKMTCTDADLAKLDVELSKIYSSRYNQAPDEAKKALRESQLDWLKAHRNICTDDVACLKKAYNDRIEAIAIIKF